MATELNELPSVIRNAHSKYPWNEWLNGSPWMIKRGEDFECSQLTMAQNLRTRAHRENRGVTVRSERSGDGALYFQFSPPR